MNKQKIVLLSLLCMVILLLSIGCSEDDGSGNIAQGTLTKLLINSIDSTNCEDLQTKPCYINFNISFLKPETTDSSWYWVGLNMRNSSKIYHIGKNMKLGPFEEEIDTVVTAYYYQGFTGAYYEMWVYRCSSYTEIGSSSCETIAATIEGDEVLISTFDSDCFTNCCTDTATTKSRWYAAVLKRLPVGQSLTKARAQMETMYATHLCGYSVGSTVETFSNTHVNIGDDSGMFVQVGLEHRRDPDPNKPPFLRYMEWSDTPATQYFTEFAAPIIGSTHSLRAEVDTVAGLVMFAYDYNLEYSFPEPYWIGKSCNYASWTAEILHHENDMAGTMNSPFKFDSCGYKNNFDYQWSSLSVDRSDFGSNDPNEWGINVSSDSVSFTVWDKKPLP